MKETCPRLIEVALPIREISAESVRDKSLRHGHISTLHLWWARRPLAACRAVVFASLVPDPDDPRCPAGFRNLCAALLRDEIPSVLRKTYLLPRYDDPRVPPNLRDAVKNCWLHQIPKQLLDDIDIKEKCLVQDDPYLPYEGMSDTLRNRLLMFIAKWSPEILAFEKQGGKQPKPENLLDDRCLVKWETSDPDNPLGREVLRIARELVKVASLGQASSMSSSLSAAEKDDRQDAYRENDRQDAYPTMNDRQDACPTDACPTVLDPFAGGGAIPLEAGRLGCRAIANDYNPVAYLILRATCEFPQKYGKPGKRKVIFEEHGKKVEHEVEVPNVLVHDFEKWAKWILERARAKIGHLYPPGKDGRPVVGYLWARTAPCSNPSCRGEIPLLRSLLVCNKPDKKVALTMDVDKKHKTVRFGIVRGRDIRETKGTAMDRVALCPFCHQPTPAEDIKRSSFEGTFGERIVAVIVEDRGGKDYRPVEEEDDQAFQKAKTLLNPALIPSEAMPDSPDLVSGRGWNFKTWGSLFNPRQLVAMQTFVACLHEALEEMTVGQASSLSRNDSQDGCPTDEYRKAVAVYLALFISRIASRCSNVGLWHTKGEKLEHPFGRQAIAMTWDYPEANPFSESTGGAEGQFDWMKRVILHESDGSVPSAVLRGDGAALSLPQGVCDVVVTDPPYFDAIAYSDLSDFFYVWLKRALGDVVPEALATPLTPKSDEAAALKHRHNGDPEKADAHFKAKLAAVLKEAHRVLKPGGIITVMFAHQSTKAWTALVHAIFEAGLTVDATWPIDTELITALKASVSALSSSVTVVCRPRLVGSAASFKEVRKEIEQVVAEAVKRFWSYGFRGADLIVACYGPAVGVFGKYERVEKADGTRVGIPELLEVAKQAARDAIAGEFRGDNLSTLYYVWANLYGTSEQAWDDARLMVQIGGESENAMEVARGHGIFVVDGPTCRLALLADRENHLRKEGQAGSLTTNLQGQAGSLSYIDALHWAMLLWKQEKRAELIAYLAERGLFEDGPFWKLAQALFEVLPRDLEDWKLVSALLGERPTLRAEVKRTRLAEPTLFDKEEKK